MNSNEMNGDQGEMHASLGLDTMDRDLANLFLSLHSSDLYQRVSVERVDRPVLRLAQREWLRGMIFYQASYRDAARAATSMLPQGMEAKVLRSLQRLNAEIQDHGEMALRDYRACGGPVGSATNQQPSPAVYAVSSVWSLVAKEGEPFSILGALYAADLTTRWVMEFLFDDDSACDRESAKRLDLPRFWRRHGLRRSLVERAVLQKVALNDPMSWKWIHCGVERILQVYPLPICEEIGRGLLKDAGRN